jgi:hypothetical protein
MTNPILDTEFIASVWKKSKELDNDILQKKQKQWYVKAETLMENGLPSTMMAGPFETREQAYIIWCDFHNMFLTTKDYNYIKNLNFFGLVEV